MPEVFQEKTQAGIESTHGTGVAATRILNGVLTPFPIDRGLVWSEVHNGSYVSRQKASYPRFMPTTSYSESVTYEDLAWWAQMFAEGGVTGVTDGGNPNPAYTYAFDPDLNTDTLKSFTLENNVGGSVYDWVQVMADTVQIRIAPDNTSEPSWMMDVGLMALGLPTSGSFASLSHRATEEVRAAGTKVFIDSSQANIGNTQVTGWLIDASISIAVNRHFKAFMENADGAAANKMGRNDRTFDMQMTVEFDNYTEYNNLISATPVPRFVRLQQEGSIIHTVVRKRARFDVAGYWTSWAASEREGNRTAVFQFQAGNIDPTFANDYKLSVVNGLATLP